MTDIYFNLIASKDIRCGRKERTMSVNLYKFYVDNLEISGIINV